MCTGLAVPTLTAGPFRLRPFGLADTDVVREAAQDPYIPLVTTVPAAFTEAEGRRFIERQWQRAERGAGYSFAIADAGTDRAVGQAGLWLRDGCADRASLGYWVVASARGQRAAGHAITAVARWALGELRIPRLELYVEPWNQASIATAERAGFCREGLLRSWQEIGGERRDMLMYSMLPADLLSIPVDPRHDQPVRSPGTCCAGGTREARRAGRPDEPAGCAVRGVDEAAHGSCSARQPSQSWPCS
jgi:RimJ/RimL family protein N-acetyltransferase